MSYNAYSLHNGDLGERPPLSWAHASTSDGQIIINSSMIISSTISIIIIIISSSSSRSISSSTQ